MKTVCKSSKGSANSKEMWSKTELGRVKVNFQESWGDERGGVRMHVTIEMYALKGVCVGIVMNICMLILAVAYGVCMDCMWFLYTCWGLE